MIIHPGTIVGNRYEVVEKKGAGGMAILYRARDRKLDRYVALKVMREEFVNTDEYVARFHVEARAAAGLSHPNIVNIYDVGQDGHVYYIVMEYIEGVTLKELINKRAPFENDEILGVAIQIASGLEHAHSSGIIHRDIKPQNILVTASGSVKVTDFGVARAANAATLVAGGNATMGSVHYLSPEQARGGYVDHKTDIYSLGICMAEMATGALPFDGESAVAVALKQINDPLPDIRAMNPGISHGVVRIIGKATEKKPSQRYQYAGEMHADLKKALSFAPDDDEGYIYERETVPEEPDETYIDTVPRGRNRNRDEMEMEDDPAADRRLVVAAVLTSIVIILVILVVGMYFIRHRLWPEDNNPPAPVAEEDDSVDEPGLTGLQLEEARILAASLGVELVVAGQENDNAAEGTVIRQRVDAADGVLRTGGTMSVFVSMGPALVLEDVPNLVGLSIDEAYELLRASSFYPDEVYEFSETMPQNVVFSQDPPAFSQAPPNSAIRFFISKGQELRSVIVPNIVGDTEAEAVRKLTEVGLTMGQATRAESETMEAGRVISQSVAGGEEIMQGRIITVVLSAGPPAEETPPTETPAPQQPVLQSSIPVNPLANIPEDVETVRMAVIKVTAAEGGVKIYDELVPVSSFPMDLSVSGNEGAAEFQVFVTDPETGSQYFFGSEIRIFGDEAADD